jgi:hypothetical protein
MRVIKAQQLVWSQIWRAVGLGIMLAAALEGCHVAPDYDPYASGSGPRVHGSNVVGDQ